MPTARRIGRAGALLPVLWAVILSAASYASAADQPILLTATRGAAATFHPRDNYQPTNVSFAVGGDVLSVGIATVQFLPAESAVVARCETKHSGGRHTASVKATLAGKQQATLDTVLTDDRPTACFLATGPGRRDGRFVLFLAGVDRMLYRNAGQLAIASPPPGKDFRVASRQIVFQKRSGQHGLVLTAPGITKANPIRIEPGRTGMWVSVPVAAAKGKPLRVTVSGFTGDALIAMENASGAGPDAAATPIVSSVSAAAPAGPSKPPAAKATAEARPIGRWEFLTGTDRAFAPLLADQREAQVTAGIKFGSAYLDANIGGDVVIAEKSWSPSTRLTFSARGLYTMRLDLCEQGKPVINSDYIGGAAVGYRRGRDQFELFAFHQSSHLGDEILEPESGPRRRERITYSREAVRFLWARQLQEDLRFYLGPTFDLCGTPSDIGQALTLQAGAEWWFSLWNEDFFLAGDLQSRQANDFGLSFTGQTGWMLAGRANRHRPRLFFEFFTGHSNMGQYWDERENTFMLGFGYNF